MSAFPGFRICPVRQMRSQGLDELLGILATRILGLA